MTLRFVSLGFAAPLFAALALAACGSGDDVAPIENPPANDAGPEAAPSANGDAGDAGDASDAQGDDARADATIDASADGDADTDTDASDAAPDASPDAADASPTCTATGNVTVTTLAELQAFEGCTVIQGSLTIDLVAPDLAPLHALEQVTGDLRIDTVSSLQGLERLSSVGGALDIGSPDVTSVDPLAALAGVGTGISITGCAKLASARFPRLAGAGFVSLQSDPLLATVDFPILSSTGEVSVLDVALTRLSMPSLFSSGLFQITNVPSLTTLELPKLAVIDGNLIFSNAPALKTLAAFSSLNTLRGDLSLLHVGALPAIDGFGQLTAIDGQITIVDAPKLTSLEGLHGIASTGGLKIDQAGALTSLEGLRGLTTVNGFVSLSNAPLADLTGLRSLQSISQSLGISALPITSLHGLEALRSVYELDVEQDPELAHLTGLERLETIGYHAQIRQLPKLVSFTSLNALTFLGQYGINVESCPALERIDGVRKLVATSSDSGVIFYDTPSLVAVDGFDALVSTGMVQITLAPKLAALHAFGQLTHVARDLRLGDEVKSSLTALDGLANLRQVDGSFYLQAPVGAIGELAGLQTVGGTLALWSTQLTTVADLKSLQSVGTLAIGGNPKLARVNVLPALKKVATALDVQDNAVLPPCEPANLLAALQAAGFTGTSTIANNGGAGTCP